MGNGKSSMVYKGRALIGCRTKTHRLNYNINNLLLKIRLAY